MAGRTSAGVGVGVTITILGILTLALFVTTTIYFGQANSAKRDFDAYKAQMAEYVSDADRNDDRVRRFQQPARESRKSLALYLADSYAAAMERVTGSKSDTPPQFNEKIAQVRAAESASLLQVIRNLQNDADALRSERDRADQARLAAIADLKAEQDRNAAIQRQQQEMYNRLAQEVSKAAADAEEYRRGTERAKADMDARVGRIEQESRDRETRLRDDLGRLREENLVLNNQLNVLRGEKRAELLRPGDEATLVDGRVVAVNARENQVTIGIGSRQKVPLGITFAVYSDASAVRIDPRTGEYPPGKAAVEVISVGENSSVCRVLFETRGTPIVVGDVIVNPVYDPNKVYKFVTFGNFDPTGRSVPTEGGRNEVNAMVEGWGGRIVDDLAGDVDFLVLGERPILPPRPSPDMPIEVQQEFIRRDREVRRYDQLYQQAQATSVPILNENRLYTLIGRLAGR